MELGLSHVGLFGNVFGVILRMNVCRLEDSNTLVDIKWKFVFRMEGSNVPTKLQVYML